jgi:hypothetical protein
VWHYRDILQESMIVWASCPSPPVRLKPEHMPTPEERLEQHRGWVLPLRWALVVSIFAFVGWTSLTDRYSVSSALQVAVGWFFVVVVGAVTIAIIGNYWQIRKLRRRVEEGAG